jgi:hypothetical protein
VVFVNFSTHRSCLKRLSSAYVLEISCASRKTGAVDSRSLPQLFDGILNAVLLVALLVAQVTLNESAWNYLRRLAKTHREVAWQPVKERYVRRVGAAFGGACALVCAVLWDPGCGFAYYVVGGLRFNAGFSYADAPISGSHQRRLYR